MKEQKSVEQDTLDEWGFAVNDIMEETDEFIKFRKPKDQDDDDDSDNGGSLPFHSVSHYGHQ